MRTRGQRGFAYVEVVLATVVVGTALASLVASMASAFGQVELASRISIAERLGREAYLLFEEEGLEETAARSGASYAPPVLATGEAATLYAGFAQEVRAAWVDPNDPATAIAPPADFLRVTVRIADAAGPCYERTWLRSRR